MPCNTDGDIGSNTSHCGTYTPPNNGGVTMRTGFYPERNTDVNWPGVDRDRVMYGGFTYTLATTGFGRGGFGGGVQPVPLTACGRATMPLPFRGFGGGGLLGNTYKAFDFFPNEISFYPIDNDQWFYYLFDTENHLVGTPCHKIITVTKTNTSTSGGTGGTGGTTTSTSSTEQICVPCTQGGCPITSTAIAYTTPDGNITGDSTQPFPTIWVAHTNTNRIAFKYEALSTQIPNGVTGLDFVFNSTSYTAYRSTTGEGDPVTLASVNPWKQGDATANPFGVFTLESGNSLGLRVRVSVKPIIVSLVDGVYTFGGTQWQFDELIAPGTGYSVDQTFTVSFTHTHTDNTQTVFTATLKVISTGPIDSTSNAGQNFNLLQVGDTVNGHTITKLYHTDKDNFLYHMVELNGSGNGFVKDQIYTSNRNHQIQVVAGKGIATRAMLLGLYEFRGKSIQYLTAALNKDVPHVFDDITQPNVTVTITNGIVTGTNIVSGGSGFQKLGRIPVLDISPPSASNGKQAILQGTFTNGALTAVKILNGGSGYSSSYPPAVFVGNLDKEVQEVSWPGLGNPESDTVLSAINELDSTVIGKIRYNHTTSIDADINTDAFSEQITYPVGTKTYIVSGSYQYFAEYGSPGTRTDVRKAFGTKEDAQTYAAEIETQWKKSESEIKSLGGSAKWNIDVTTSTEDPHKIAKTYLDAQITSFKKEAYVGKVTKIDESETTSAEDIRKRGEEILKSQSRTKRIDLIRNIEPNIFGKKRDERLEKSLLERETVELLPDVKEPVSEWQKTTTEAAGENENLKEWAKITGDALIDTNTKMANVKDAMIQKQYPEKYQVVENMVRTQLGTFSQLPCASRYTKYLIKQYIPDKRVNSSISVTLSTTNQNSGCVQYDPQGSVPCPCATSSYPSRTEVNGSSTSFLQSILNPNAQGVGCQNWSISGTIQVFNNLTTSANVFATAVGANGNPFPNLC